MQVSNLTYGHSKEKPPFFKNLSFEIPKGKIHALHGKNGSGKSILLGLLAGQQPDEAEISGSISVDGGVILLKQCVDSMIVDDFSFTENLKLATMPRFPSPFTKLPKAPFVPDLAQRFDINVKVPANSLSDGQRQILALCMVLRRPVQVLLLDEPTATLDAQNANLVFEFLQEIPNRTFCIVCHDRELISRYTNGVHLELKSDGEGVRHLTGIKLPF